MSEKKNLEQKIIWKYRKPNGHNSPNNLRSILRLQKNTSENINSTAQAASDIFTMSLDNQVSGLAAVALRADGSHYLVLSGSAIDQNIRASGAAFDLLNELNQLSDQDDTIL